MFLSLLNSTVLVTGGTGSIGSAIVRQLIEHSAKVIVFSRDEYKQYELKQELKSPKVQFIIGDIKSFDSINAALRGVHYCFHTAAMKHVPICEENPFEAVKTNIIGTENLINAAIANKVYKVLAVSTDKAVHPTSVLGCTKLVMERLMKNRSHMAPRLASIRFGNILNSRGSVLPLWKKQAENGIPLTVTDVKATRYFIEIEEAVKHCLQAMEIMKGGETFVVKCGDPKNIYDMAKKISSHIVTTGLHPGERLHETLFTEDENIVKEKIADRLWAV